MRLICALSIVFVLGTTPAFADETKYEPKIIPRCTLVKTAAGVDACAYTLQQWKVVLKADAELVSNRRLLDLERQKNKLLEQQKIDFQKQAELCAANQNLLIKHDNKLTLDHIALDKKYQNERVKPRLGSPVAWTVAAVAISVLAGFVIKDVAN